MPTIQEVQKLKQEVEQLKRQVAEKQGALKQLRQEAGESPDDYRKRLTELETERVSVEQEFQQKLNAYAKRKYERKH